ncbi:MCM family protein, partial [Candidatus Haloredivivus sp. G17]
MNLSIAIKISSVNIFRPIIWVGKSSTGAGLTASVVKEESTGEFSLEAGAVVLAHKGMAAIDEIDKMSVEDRSSLHEAMEQQQIS